MTRELSVSRAQMKPLMEKPEENKIEILDAVLANAGKDGAGLSSLSSSNQLYVQEMAVTLLDNPLQKTLKDLNLTSIAVKLVLKYFFYFR
jgi:hypothetical protein